MKAATLMIVLSVVGPIAPSALSQEVPRELRGKIITSKAPVDTSAAGQALIRSLQKQDCQAFQRDENGKWTIYFLAFFDKPLSGDKIGIVVLDPQKNPVALADVPGQPNQWTLSSQISVETTEAEAKPHTLQVYFARSGKPVELAKKSIILK